MASFKKAVDVAFQPSDVFDLVSDIRAYPSFIKWIKAMRVSNAREEDGVQYCLGDSVVGFKGFTERFATNVTADRDKLYVQADLVRGPFRKLQARWQIIPLETGGCNCALSIDYEFSNFLIGMLAAANQEMAADRILSAFLKEAEKRFGAPTAALGTKPTPPPTSPTA